MTFQEQKGKFKSILKKTDYESIGKKAGIHKQNLFNAFRKDRIEDFTKAEMEIWDAMLLFVENKIKRQQKRSGRTKEIAEKL